MSPDFARFESVVRRALRRDRIRLGLIGAGGGLIAAALLVVGAAEPAWPRITATAFVTVAAGAGLALLVARPSRTSAIDVLERHEPRSRNLLRTAMEIAETRTQASPFVTRRVLAEATKVGESADLGRAFPFKGAIVGVALGFGCLALGIAVAARGGGAAVAEPSSASSATIETVRATVRPPEYSGHAVQQVRNPDRLEVLAGSTIELTIDADAARVIVSTLAGSAPASRAAGTTFASAIRADADGFVSVEAHSTDGTVSTRRLIGLRVVPDNLPAVRLTAPAKDLLVPDGNRTLEVAVEADDDLALASLGLTFTKISGSGENFEFVNGEVPVTIARSSERQWTASASWPLAGLALEPGDMVVYRAVARDRRPGGAAAESDAFFVEIAAPGALPSEGFAVDDRFDRYAISQQMVILKTERLLASRGSIAAADFEERALDLAAEQRQVRAEFVFMMGGHLEDLSVDPDSLNEEVEAAGEDDLAAGRLVNRGRAEIMRAIRAMSRAAARLADLDATGALPVEKEALTYLQRAFSRSRIILRTLGERERLDLSRRLTGTLASLARDARPATSATPSPVATAARRVLADLSAIAARADAGHGPSTAELTPLVQAILAIRPGSAALRDVAAALTSGDLRKAADGLTSVIRADSPLDPGVLPSPELGALSGALADALRQGVRR